MVPIQIFLIVLWERPHYIYSCNRPNSHSIKLLLKFNADVNCQDVDGMTPLFLLFKCTPRIGRTTIQDDEESLHCMRLLLDNHADVNLLDKHGLTCLYIIEFITRQHRREVIQLLSNYSNVDVNFQLLQPFNGIRPNGVVIKGDTILHYAVRKKDIEYVKIRIEVLKPNLLIRNSYNKTAYDIAQQSHHKAIMECLKITLLLQCHVYLRNNWICYK